MKKSRTRPNRRKAPRPSPRGEGPAAHSALVDTFPDRALESPTRSLVPFLAYWAKPRERLHAIRNDFGGEKALDHGELQFEYPVASVAPHHASFTDLMALAPKSAVAFSASWTEPMSETIERWRQRRSPGQAKAVLDGWFAMIAAVTGRKSAWAPEDDPLVYETVQQAASLCRMARPRFNLVYQLFGGWHEREYEAALSRLTERIGERDRVAVWMQVVPTTPSSQFETLRKHWRDLPPASRVFELRELLGEGKAFHFGDATWLRFV